MVRRSLLTTARYGAVAEGLGLPDDPVVEDGPEHPFGVIDAGDIASVRDGASCGGAQQVERGDRRDAQKECRVGAGGGGLLDDEATDGLGHLDAIDRRTHRPQVGLVDRAAPGRRERGGGAVVDRRDDAEGRVDVGRRELGTEEEALPHLVVRWVRHAFGDRVSLREQERRPRSGLDHRDLIGGSETVEVTDHDDVARRPGHRCVVAEPGAPVDGDQFAADGRRHALPQRRHPIARSALQEDAAGGEEREGDPLDDVVGSVDPRADRVHDGSEAVADISRWHRGDRFGRDGRTELVTNLRVAPAGPPCFLADEVLEVLVIGHGWWTPSAGAASIGPQRPTEQAGSSVTRIGVFVLPGRGSGFPFATAESAGGLGGLGVDRRHVQYAPSRGPSVWWFRWR